ncbi:fructosamine kinase [Trebonia kvetii]|uniref:Fructosamine kinase n=1 Tax=Trebonia kvetii TaxID=2480626 RepID=A0A6P2BZ75_9ACTN|nr:fructosamine kinase family protein [Trebonia kvetii]TVZ04422.1 fructosamine kinase [Trebonia kvetii]
MSSLSQRIGEALGIPFARLREAGGQHGVRHLTGTLADGRDVFVKAGASPDGESAAAFAAEANGLRWLAGADGGPPVPQVIGVSAEFLVIELIGPQENPPPGAARRFGADLARLHAAGAPAFGAPWPGYIASLPLDNTPLDSTPLDSTPPDSARANREEPDWAAWYAERRLLPYLRRARDQRALPAAEARQVEAVIARIGELAGPPEKPSRIHGDLWSGNVLWSAGRGWPIDPAAHGGHRETDLAMLALFGAPDLAEILRGYTETVPLAEGWRARVPLHQLHPLLVHVCLFGLGYAPQLNSAARAALAGRQG